MPHVSKRKLRKSTELELIDTLALVFTKTSKKEDVLAFLSALVSPTEKLMMAKRLAIMILLNEHVPESDIAETLNVTRETVSRVQLKGALRGSGYTVALKKLAEEKKWQQFKKTLLSLARYSARAARGYVKPTILD